MTQVAFVSTSEPTLRSEIWGWTYEDSALFVHKTLLGSVRPFIGFTPEPKDIPDYHTVLQMLADGWELLAPPKEGTWQISDDSDPIPCCDWWLTRRR